MWRLVLGLGLVVGCSATDTLDSSICGDAACAPGETDESCPEDCAPNCGDMQCHRDESCETCPEDCGACAPPDRLMYVSLLGEPRLAVATLMSDGTMETRSSMDLAMPGNGGPMAHAREARRLYVRTGSDGFATVSLSQTGMPTLLGNTAGVGRITYAAPMYNDSVLVSVHFGDDLLQTYDLSAGPPHNTTNTLDVQNEPHAAFVGPGNRVYVPHRSADVIQWFDVTPEGVATFVGELAATPGAGPRHIAFSPDGAFAYVINEFDDTVSVHTVDANGGLNRIQRISTLANGVDGSQNTCADVHVTPDGRFVYGSNRGDDSIAMFAVQSDGMLAFQGTVPTEAIPREFELSRDGAYLVVAGQDSNNLESFRIESNGALSSQGQLAIGTTPLWVVID